MLIEEASPLDVSLNCLDAFVPGHLHHPQQPGTSLRRADQDPSSQRGLGEGVRIRPDCALVISLYVFMSSTQYLATYCSLAFPLRGSPVLEIDGCYDDAGLPERLHNHNFHGGTPLAGD